MKFASLIALVLLQAMLYPCPAMAGIDLSAFKKEMRELYKFRVSYPTKNFDDFKEHGSIRGRSALPSELKFAAAELKKAFDKYPDKFIRFTGLRKLVLCADLKFRGVRAGGFVFFGEKIMYIDAKHAKRLGKNFERMVHHEFYHLVDLIDDGLMDHDAEWTGLNHKNAHYGQGGLSMAGDLSLKYARISKPGFLKMYGTPIDQSTPGFLSIYGTASPAEDKAEYFGNMMTRYSQVQNYANRDEVIQKKMSLMKDRLRLFNKGFDTEYWDELSEDATIT